MKKYPERVDLDKCEDEPIHLIPKIQNHGCVLVLNSEQKIIQCSDNVENCTGIPSEAILKKPLRSLFSETEITIFEAWLEDPTDHLPFSVTLQNTEFSCIPHISDTFVILDLEPDQKDWNPMTFQRNMLSVYRRLTQTETIQNLVEKAADLIKELLGYDRVMIYRFDKDWNGTVYSEAKEQHLESFLGLHYPASDIPKNARELFMKQGVRIISDIEETYSDLTPTLNSETGNLTNVGRSHLRGASAIHIEYLSHMGVGASLTCAIVHNNELWGLVACHHYSPKYIDYRKRHATLLLSEMISNQISQKHTQDYLEKLKETSAIRSKLIDNLTNNWDIVKGLTAKKVNAMHLFECSGFCILHDGEMVTIGAVPPEEEIQRMVKELEYNNMIKDGCFATDHLANHINWSEELAKTTSGVILCKLSGKTNEALIWFRPEQVTQVKWGGNPYENKNSEDKNIRLSPRKSFEKWVEKVQFTSEAWQDFELASAQQLTDDIKNVIVTKFGEISDLNRKLSDLNKELESFSYSVSHDLRGPLRSIDGFAQILLEDHYDVLDAEGKKSLNTIINSASKMNTLIDEILSYSGLSQTRIIPEYIDVVALCHEIAEDNFLSKDYPNTELKINTKLPKIFGDKALIYQVFSNLLTNAYKYSSYKKHPKVSIDFNTVENKDVFHIKDNGIGFKSKYSHKIFGIFTRLVKDEYKGNGVGLAIAQRIILKHGGEIWAEGKLNKGAKFSFYIPDPN